MNKTSHTLFKSPIMLKIYLPKIKNLTINSVLVMCFVPTRSLWGPLSTEFQFQVTLDLQFVQPSWCLLVRTKYLEKTKQTTEKRTLLKLEEMSLQVHQKVHLDNLRAPICDIRTWVNWMMLTCCARSPFPCSFHCWPRTWTPITKQHWKRERQVQHIRAVWPKLSVLNSRFFLYRFLVYFCSETKRKRLLRRLQRFPPDIFSTLICLKMQ